MAYTEDCADLGVKVTRICKSFEGTVAVSVRSTVCLGACDDLSPEWRKVTWEAVKEKVDGHFKLTAKLDDLRPVYSRALILDSYDSFASMHVALTVFVSALAKKDAELGTGALPATTKRDIVLKALKLSPLCKHWLENITFESAAEILKFLLENVSECVAFERKFGHAPGCRTHPVYKKGAETKIHTAFRTRSQRRHIWRFRRPSPSFLRLSPNQQYRWRPSRATNRRQRGLSGPCTPVQTAEDALTGDTSLGSSRERIRLEITRERGSVCSVHQTVVHHFLHWFRHDYSERRGSFKPVPVRSKWDLTTCAPVRQIRHTYGVAYPRNEFWPVEMPRKHYATPASSRAIAC